MRKIFTLVVHNVNSKNSMEGVHLVNKGGKIGKKKKQSNIDQEYEKKLHSFRKKRNMSCLCFDALFSRNKKRGGGGRKVRKREKGKGAPSIRDSVFVFCPPFSQLI